MRHLQIKGYKYMSIFAFIAAIILIIAGVSKKQEMYWILGIVLLVLVSLSMLLR